MRPIRDALTLARVARKVQAMTKDKWFELAKIVVQAVVVAVAGYFGIRMGVPSTVTVTADTGPAFTVRAK